MYGHGKKTGLVGKHGVTADMGKKTPATFSKVTASAGKSSGTARGGDPKGCSPMGGKGK